MHDDDDVRFQSTGTAWVLWDDIGRGPFVVAVTLDSDTATAWPGSGRGRFAKWADLYQADNTSSDA